MAERTYKKQLYSGICVCGHEADDHHGGVVMNKDYYAQTGESRIAQECEFYGFNETGGLMYVHPGESEVCGRPDCHKEHEWIEHCGYFHDRDDPEPR